MNGLTFAEIALYISRKPAPEQEETARRFQENLGLDMKKLLAEARTPLTAGLRPPYPKGT